MTGDTPLAHLAAASAAASALAAHQARQRHPHTPPLRDSVTSLLADLQALATVLGIDWAAALAAANSTKANTAAC